MEQQKLSDLQIISEEARRRILLTLVTAGSGHLGGSLSSLELMTSLYFGNVLRYDPSNASHPMRDRVLVRGHLGPLRYSLFSMIGWTEEDELIHYRRLGSRLQGHEMMGVVPGVDITPSGSLGMLLSYGTGAAYSFRVQQMDPTVYVFLGDGEEQEGNVSEAARHASSLKLNNLVCILDRNGKQLSRPTSEVDGATDAADIWRGYGWSVQHIADGHSYSEILEVFTAPRDIARPTLIIADTVKGHGVDGAADHTSGYHTIGSCPKDISACALENATATALPTDVVAQAVQRRLETIKPLKPLELHPRSDPVISELQPNGESEYDDALLDYLQKMSSAAAADPKLNFYSLTADWTNRRLSEMCGFLQPGAHYLDVGIREQHLMAMCHGIAISDPSSFIITTDGDFLSLRGADQLQSIAQAGSSMIIIGTDSGICEPMNGATHQSSGQPGALINMPGLTFLEPADSLDLCNCLNWAAANYYGPIYLRLHSGRVEPFSIDPDQRNISAYVCYEPESEIEMIVAGSGLTLQGCVQFARIMDMDGRGIRVVNVINQAALDETFCDLLINDAPMLTVYNGNPQILQSAVSRAILERPGGKRPSVIKSHGFLHGTSGTLDELLHHFKFDAHGIETIARQLL